MFVEVCSTKILQASGALHVYYKMSRTDTSSARTEEVEATSSEDETFSEVDDDSLESDSQQAENTLSQFLALDRFLVPLDAKACSYCEEKECARVSVRIFIPGTNSRRVRNHYNHPQNKAIIPVCKLFFDRLQNSYHSTLSPQTEEGKTRAFIILATAGFVFQKYYLVTPHCVRYFYHVKRTRLSHRFDFQE